MDTEQTPRTATPTVPVRTSAVLMALGVAFDLAANGQVPGLAVTVFVALLCLAVRAYAPKEREVDVLLGGAFLLSVFPAIHSTDVVLALDVVSACALIGLAATRGEDSVLRTSLLALTRRGFALAEAALRVPLAALSTIGAGVRRLAPARIRAALRIVLIVVPVLALFAALLASADRVFGRILFPHVKLPDLSAWMTHVLLFLIGTGGATTLWIATRRATSLAGREPRERTGALRFAEWALVLGGINLLYLLFAAVQFAVLFGGNHRVQVTPGLTYAEYARSGFFQLVAVAVLTLFVIVGVWDLGKRDDARQHRVFAASVTGMVALTGVILASAFVRLTLYQRAFGFTIERLIAYAVVAWIAFMLIGLLTTIATGARERVVAMLVGTGLVVLVGLNAIEPGRFVAQRNAVRFEATRKIDTGYLPNIGFDAVPIAIRLLPSLPKDERIALRAELCGAARDLSQHHDVRSANLSRTRARESLARARITPESCPT